jgi:hypothetical protein
VIFIYFSNVIIIYYLQKLKEYKRDKNVKNNIVVRMMEKMLAELQKKLPEGIYGGLSIIDDKIGGLSNHDNNFGGLSISEKNSKK